MACIPPTATIPANPPGDFLTGGGFIIATAITSSGTQPPARKNFGVGGGCKEGGNGHGLWGHLEYIDHGMGLNVHWTTITAYAIDIFGDSRARFICGEARTNSPTLTIPSMVNFAVRAADDEQSGGVDRFDIRLTDKTGLVVYYTTFGVGSPPPFHPLAGGNITLHQPNPSTMGAIDREDCPAFPGVTGGLPL